jgi:hypothetical protein
MIYKEYQRNHVILPGREDALAAFLKQDYKGMQHKLKNAVSSNSEDALTWSCFDVIQSLAALDKASASDEILEDSFHGRSPLSFRTRQINTKSITIHVGKKYTGLVQGVPQDEGNAVGAAQVGQPVPGKHALTGDDQPVAVSSDRLEEGGGIGGEVLVQADRPGLVEDAQVHGPSVQIDAAIESVRYFIGRLLVKAHHGLLAMGAGA